MVQDDPNKPGYNIKEKVQTFIDLSKRNATNFVNENHIMFTMGDDFHYSAAVNNYRQLDMLIKHTNARTEETGVHLLYSTPYCYLKALHEAKDTYPTKKDDFFPYRNSKELDLVWSVDK